jgi:hypothetical protein
VHGWWCAELRAKRTPLARTLHGTTFLVVVHARAMAAPFGYSLATDFPGEDSIQLFSPTFFVRLLRHDQL